MSKPRPDELLAAYLDGVAELGADDRRRVDDLLRDQPGSRADAAATRALLDRLRALPPAGEPDWAAIERGIRNQVGVAMPRPWWRRITWLVPIGGCAAAATVAVLWLHHPAPEPLGAGRDAGVAAIAPAPIAATALWLDGEVIEVGDVDPMVLVLVGDHDESHDTLAVAPDDSILPVEDLGWVDTLDDTAIDRAEHWFARKKG